MRLIRDPNLAFMAVAYVGGLGMARGWTCADDDMFGVSASILQILRGIVRDLFA